WFGLVIASSAVPAWNYNRTGGEIACEMSSDCAAQCPDGQIPICFDDMWSCLDDVADGKTGPYSDVDKASNGDAYVSAYSVELGDLVVARPRGLRESAG